MKLRTGLAITAAILTMAAALPPAEAASGPRRLQRLAAAQTQLLFRFYNGQPQVTSPADCQRARQAHDDGVFILPTLSFATGDVTLTCRIEARRVLVDLAGFTVTEDNRGDTYTLADGEPPIAFTRANLQRICDDVIRFVPQAPATLDGHPIAGTQVITHDLTVRVNPDANDPPPGSPFFQDSVDLGHPGTLTACFSGYEALLRLRPGHHVLHVDLSGIANSRTTITYNLEVPQQVGAEDDDE